MAINRKVYQLFKQEGWSIELVAPETLTFPTGVKAAQPAAAGDPPIHFLPLKGDNPRTYSFEGLTALLDQRRPVIVLLDNDPVSRLAGAIGQWCSNNQSALFCVSNENLSLGLMDTIRRRGPGNLAAAVMKRWMLYRNRKVIEGIFCINRDGKKVFEAEGFRGVRRMPLGFDPTIFFPDDKAAVAIKEKHGFHTKIIAYFGRLIPEKGIHILIGALQQLKNRDWQLMMDHFDEYASDYHREVKKAISASGIDGQVIFVHPDHVEIAAYMNAADVIVVPSVSTPAWKEQYGRVAAEGMACGTTVIASDCGALPELINGHGLLFREGDTAALMALLEKFLAGEPESIPPVTSIARYAKEQLSIYRQKNIMEEAFDAFLKSRPKTVEYENISGR